jgi:hypothetical protein
VESIQSDVKSCLPSSEILTKVQGKKKIITILEGKCENIMLGKGLAEIVH